MLTPPGLWLGRFAVAWNSALLIREIWYRFCSPGTFRALVRAAWTSITTGQSFQWPSELSLAASGTSFTATGADSAAPADPLRWYVTTADLDIYKDAVERNVGAPWEQMLRKEWEGCTYTAWRRPLPSGRTEYKSVTVCEDATAQEFMDFYLDDDVRPRWDGMITEHQLLESAHDSQHRCQVVRWLRSFPFAFISKREYVIARRIFPGSDPNTLYGITKGVEHPAAPMLQGVVRMSTFYSMWCSRTIPCPKGSGRPACETTLLHFEDFGIPENLAKFTVRHGMAGFVQKMLPHVPVFVADRRSRCQPTEADPRAYGHGIEPLLRAGCGSFMHVSTPGKKRVTIDSDESSSETSSISPKTLKRSSSFRGLGYMLLASGVAIALSRAGSASSLHGMDREEDGVDRDDGHDGKRRHGRAHRAPKHRHGGLSHHSHHRPHHHNGASGALRSHRIALTADTNHRS